MENIFNEINYKKIIKEYNHQVNLYRRKAFKILNVFFIIYIIVMILLLILFPTILKGESEGTESYYIFGGIIGVSLLIGYIINKLVISEKPFYNYLIKEVIEELNKSRESKVEYSSFPKKPENVNKIGGLFTRGAALTVKSIIKGKTNSYHNFKVHNDARLYTTDGKNYYSLFTGIYIVIEYPVGKTFQIRSHTKPNLKGTKFIKSNEVNNLKTFTVKDDLSSYVEEKYVNLVSMLKDNLNAKKVYFAANNDSIHFAFESNEPLKRPKTLNQNTLNKIIDRTNKFLYVPNNIMDALN